MRRSSDRSIEAVAPLRISFVGGGTDFPHWFDQHGGAVVSATIDHAVRVTVTPRADRRVRVRSVDLDRWVTYDLDDGPRHGGVLDLATAAIHRVGAPFGIDVETHSDAPAGSGLGGSSALVTAMVAALHMLAGRAATAEQVARLAYTIERHDLAISGGWQDQYAAAFGGANLMEFSSSGARLTPLALPAERVDAIERRLLLCYTGRVRRNVGLIDRQIAMHDEGREETHQGMKELHEMAYVVRGVLEAGDLAALGACLDQAFAAKKRMNPHVTEETPIEAMLEAARAAGSDGGKICGAGGGGYLLIACAPERRAVVSSALVSLGGQLAPFSLFTSGVRAHRATEEWAPTA